jgi:hypothetical protein
MNKTRTMHGSMSSALLHRLSVLGCFADIKLLPSSQQDEVRKGLQEGKTAQEMAAKYRKFAVTSPQSEIDKWNHAVEAKKALRKAM